MNDDNSGDKTPNQMLELFNSIFGKTAPKQSTDWSLVRATGDKINKSAFPTEYFAEINKMINGALSDDSADSPDNEPSVVPIPSNITIVDNEYDGTINVLLQWKPYIQGEIRADGLRIFWNDSGNKLTDSDNYLDAVLPFLPSGSSSKIPAPSYMLAGLDPSKTYNFGIAAVRGTEYGTTVGEISTSKSWSNVCADENSSESDYSVEERKFQIAYVNESVVRDVTVTAYDFIVDGEYVVFYRMMDDGDMVNVALFSNVQHITVL